MKKKEIIALVLFGVLLAVVATLLIGRGASGSKKKHTAQVEVVQEITPEFSSDAKSMLLGQDEQNQVQSFTPQLNLPQGLDNTSPFRSGD